MDKITLLGTKGGPAIRQQGAMPTASLLQFAGKNILIDCAIGCTKSTVDAGVNLLEIDAIFITHLHSDHVLELGPLLYTAWTTGLGNEIQVYGPEGTALYWQRFVSAMSFDHAIRLADEGRPPLENLVKITEFSEGPIAFHDDITVSALRVEHPPVTDCFALKFESSGKTVVFSADTCFFPPLAEFSTGADVLVHEAMLLDGVEKLVQRTPGADRLRAHLLASHTPAEQVGEIAQMAQVKHLVLNHMVPADDPDFDQTDWTRAVSETWSGKLSVGYDGRTITF